METVGNRTTPLSPGPTSGFAHILVHRTRKRPGIVSTHWGWVGSRTTTGSEPDPGPFSFSDGPRPGRATRETGVKERSCRRLSDGELTRNVREGLVGTFLDRECGRWRCDGGPVDGWGHGPPSPSSCRSGKVHRQPSQKQKQRQR